MAPTVISCPVFGAGDQRTCKLVITPLMQ